MGAIEQLRLKVIIHDAREEVLKAEMESQYARLSDLQETYLVSQNENSKLLQEHGSLVKAFSCSNVKNNMLEEKNDVILGETLALDIRSLIFKSFGAEKALEVKYFDEEMDHLQGVIGGLEKGIRSMVEMLEVVQMEKLKMEESVELMKNELNREKIENDQLNAKVGTVIGLLCLKEVELLEAGQMFKDTENENVKLEKKCKGLIMEADGANVIRELTKLREEVEERKSVEDEVLSEIQEKGNEVSQWETRASTYYEDLQISNICVVLFEEKVHEYAEACESFEGEFFSKDAEIEQLKERLIFLEGENEGMLIIKSIKRKQFTKQPSEDKSLEDELDSPRSPTIPTLEGILTKEMLENDTTTVASEREPTNENPILQKHVNRKLFSVTEKSGRTAFDNMEDVEDINDDTSNDRSNNNVEMDDKEENINEEEDKLNIIFIVIQYFMIFR
ncbi:hypothetical protein GIB67_026111 [Kingdonia uniflora]|uniref:Uncharacterized protein n=1 Tax=Kingdonia uniflora TaxID=39325 RepID=A0A7J7M2Y9_9MAGN|nr:hypothetical protein GIB67_026111 [Kingdonia uniflora]